jgi:hypothetical protein
LQVHGDQQRKSGDLPRGAGRRERLAVAHAQHLPTCRLALFSKYRADAQSLPEFAQRTQNGRFGKLAAESFPGVGGGESSVFVQNLP